MRQSRFLRLAISVVTVLFCLVLSAVAQQQPMDSPQSVTPPAAAAAAVSNDNSGTPANQPSDAAKMAATAQAIDAQNNAPTLQSRDARYHINKTDVFSVNFVFTPEYDQNLQVQPDGYVVPRGVESIHAEGMTIPEFTTALEKSYGKILHDPVITVLPTNVVPAYFIAGGQVQKPGRYTFQGDTTVSQAVEIAGGFTTNAKHSQVVLFRRINNDWVQGTKIDVKKMLKEGNLAEDLHLQAGDMLYVPQNQISKLQPWLTPVSQFVKLNLFTKPITFGF